MCVHTKMRVFVGLLLLGSGLAVANDTEPAVPDRQTGSVQGAPTATPVMAPLPQVWPQMMAVPSPPFYYVMPQPGMVWPMWPQYQPYPFPLMMPPFVWMMVPMQTATPGKPASAEADDGPVAATPGVAISSSTQGVGLAADASVAELPPSAERAPAQGAAEPVAEAVAASVSMVAVDYGPVAPTPVVDWPALQQPATVISPRKRLRANQKSVSKPDVAMQPKPRPATVTEPAKKRMCWTKGVVAPCR